MDVLTLSAVYTPLRLAYLRQKSNCLCPRTVDGRCRRLTNWWVAVNADKFSIPNLYEAVADFFDKPLEPYISEAFDNEVEEEGSGSTPGSTSKESGVSSPSTNKSVREVKTIGGLILGKEVSHAINIDVHRTFPNVEKFSKREQNLLRRVLSVFAYYDPIVSYVQGMNFIAAFLLWHGTEQQAFWILVGMMYLLDVRHMFLPYFPGLEKRCSVIEMLLGTACPALVVHMEQCHLDTKLTAFEWLLTIFSSSLPFEALNILWDAFFTEGWIVIYRLIILRLIRLKDSLLVADDIDEIMSLIKHSLPYSTRGLSAKKFKRWFERQISGSGKEKSISFFTNKLDDIVQSRPVLIDVFSKIEKVAASTGLMPSNGDLSPVDAWIEIVKDSLRYPIQLSTVVELEYRASQKSRPSLIGKFFSDTSAKLRASHTHLSDDLAEDISEDEHPGIDELSLADVEPSAFIDQLVSDTVSNAMNELKRSGGAAQSEEIPANTHTGNQNGSKRLSFSSSSSADGGIRVADGLAKSSPSLKAPLKPSSAANSGSSSPSPPPNGPPSSSSHPQIPSQSLSAPRTFSPSSTSSPPSSTSPPAHPPKPDSSLMKGEDGATSTTAISPPQETAGYPFSDKLLSSSNSLASPLPGLHIPPQSLDPANTPALPLSHGSHKEERDDLLKASEHASIEVGNAHSMKTKPFEETAHKPHLKQKLEKLPTKGRGGFTTSSFQATREASASMHTRSSASKGSRNPANRSASPLTSGGRKVGSEELDEFDEMNGWCTIYSIEPGDGYPSQRNPYDCPVYPSSYEEEGIGVSATKPENDELECAEHFFIGGGGDMFGSMQDIVGGDLKAEDLFVCSDNSTEGYEILSSKLDLAELNATRKLRNFRKIFNVHRGRLMRRAQQLNRADQNAVKLLSARGGVQRY